MGKVGFVGVGKMGSRMAVRVTVLGAQPTYLAATRRLLPLASMAMMIFRLASSRAGGRPRFWPPVGLLMSLPRGERGGIGD